MKHQWTKWSIGVQSLTILSQSAAKIASSLGGVAESHTHIRSLAIQQTKLVRKYFRLCKQIHTKF